MRSSIYLRQGCSDQNRKENKFNILPRSIRAYLSYPHLYHNKGSWFLKHYQKNKTIIVLSETILKGYSADDFFFFFCTFVLLCY